MCACTRALLSITQLFDSLVSLNFVLELAGRFCTDSDPNQTYLTFVILALLSSRRFVC
jgi:hypothetical protein